MEKVYADTFRDTLYCMENDTCNITVQGQGSLFIVCPDDVSCAKIHLDLKAGSQSRILLQNQNVNSIQIEVVVQVDQDAHCSMGYLDMENGQVSYTQKVYLKAPGAELQLQSAQLGQADTNKKNDIEIIHQAPHTYGNMENFAVLFDRAQYDMVANGNIQKGCYGSQSHQTTRVLTLGKDHKAQVIPLLLIDENDVKASHAQTIGQPDEEQLYYLQSRGLSHKQAMGLLSIGYLLPVLDLIEDEDHKAQMRQEMESKVGLYGNGKDS